LVVDQDQTAARVLKALFTPDGFQVVVVGTGEEAWERLVATPFDLLITDARATLDDGRLLSAVLQSQDLISRSRVILSVPGVDHAGGETPVGGGFPVLTKPFNPKKVHQSALAALQRP
jgi:CheY-like chemotaxis protein